MMQPLEFQPIFKRIRWGGRRLGDVLNKPIGEHDDYAESWELVDRADEQSVVLNGPFRGWTLGRLVRERGAELLGRRANGDRFPLLLKYLDAHDRLSVQVHPDDRRAAQFCQGELGKTEAWVILSATPESRLYVGLQAGVDRSALERALSSGTVADCLHSIPVAEGDCLHVPAGTVHSIGEGIVLAEVQQSSDLTFRLFDWGRVDSQGQPRPLHIAEAVACIDFTRGPVDPVSPRIVHAGDSPVEELVRNKYFVLQRRKSTVGFWLPADDRCRVLMLLKGDGAMTCGGERRKLPFGTTLLVPAAAPETHVQPEVPGQDLTVLEVSLP